MANPNTYPSDGRLTTLQNFTGTLNGTELMELVSPGNASQGVNYNVTTQTLASLVASLLNFLVRNGQTANYTLQTTDANKLIALGGGTLFTLTVNAASGYASNFWCLIYNEDASRGKALVINGLTSFILWPNQSVLLLNDNNTWVLSPNNQPWVITSSGATINVDNVNGSDSILNDGLGPQGGTGSFATIQHAFTVIQKQFLQLQNSVLIKLPQTTSVPITEQVSAVGAMPGGVGTIQIRGNTNSPTSCAWQIVDGGVALSLQDYQSVTVNGVGFKNSGTSGGIFLQAAKFCQVDLTNSDLGFNGPNGVGISLGYQSRGNLLSNSLSGTTGVLAQVTEGCTFGALGVLTINGTFSAGYMFNPVNGGIADVGALSFANNTSGLSGTRYLAQSGGQVIGDASVSWPSTLGAGIIQTLGRADAAITTIGNVVFTGLPAAPQKGMIAIVTDAQTTAPLGTTIAVGGGTSTVFAGYDGAAWRIFLG